MKFQLKDKTSGQLITAHQAFIRLTNAETKEEIIFITEADNTLTNKFDLVSILLLSLIPDNGMCGSFCFFLIHISIQCVGSRRGFVLAVDFRNVPCGWCS